MYNCTYLSRVNDNFIRLDCELWVQFANMILSWDFQEDSYWYEEMFSSHLLYDC